MGGVCVQSGNKFNGKFFVRDGAATYCECEKADIDTVTKLLVL
jgi:hypothetical protein